MKSLILMALFGAVLEAQPLPQGILFVRVNPVGACVNPTSLRYNTTNGNLSACNAGLWALIGAGGGGGVTHSVGALTSTAIVTGNGTGDLQTPCATCTLSAAGLLRTPGNIAAGSPGVGIATGDLSAARTATTGAVFLGSDGNAYIFRDAAGDTLIGTGVTIQGFSFSAANPGLKFTYVQGGLSFKTGANSRIGTGTLVGGTLAVANTSITANSQVFIQDTGGGTIANIGNLYVASQTVGVGFTVTSTNVLDTSTFRYWVFEVN